MGIRPPQRSTNLDLCPWGKGRGQRFAGHETFSGGRDPTGRLHVGDGHHDYRRRRRRCNHLRTLIRRNRPRRITQELTRNLNDAAELRRLGHVGSYGIP